MEDAVKEANQTEDGLKGHQNLMAEQKRENHGEKTDFTENVWRS